MLTIDNWLRYWHRKININGVFPDEIAIPERFYKIMLSNYPFIGVPKTFFGSPFKILWEQEAE